MTKMFLILVFVSSALVINAQKKKPIELGKPFPYKANSELNALFEKERSGKNRKVILDLFSASCPTCFGMMPKMQMLQDHFGDSLLVVLLGKKGQGIEKVYERFRNKLSLRMDVIYDAGFFQNYSIPGVPHYVWIGDKGIVEAVTSVEELNDITVSKFLAGQPPEVVKQEKQPFDFSKPLFLHGNGGPDSVFLHRSILSIWDNSQALAFPRRLQFTREGPFFQAMRVTADELYRWAYFGRGYWSSTDPEYSKYSLNLVRLNKSPLDSPGTWYNYSFATSIAGKDSTLLQRALRNDLSTYFGYTVSVRKMSVPCWKLVARQGVAEKLRSKYDKKQTKADYAFRDYKCVPISSLIADLSRSEKGGVPIIDATGISFPVDFVLEAVVHDRDSMVSAIRLLGFDLVKGEAEMDVLVLEKQ